MINLKTTLIFFLISLGLICFGQSSEWSTWRGPNANGSITQSDLNYDKILVGQGLLWSTDVGTGHSSVAVNGNMLYTMGNWEISENYFIDRVVCLDVNTGEIIWKYEYKMDEMEDPGPFSTPVIDDEYLYTLGRGGQLYCFNSSKGNIIWSKNLVEQGLTNKDSEFACTPVILNDLLLLNINLSGMALNKMTGELIWNSEPDQRSLSTALLFNKDGVEYIAVQGDKETRAVNPRTGEVVWMIPEGHICDPIILDDKLLIYSYKGSSLYKLDNSPVRLWHNPDIKAQFQSYVTVDGYSYGFSNYGGMKLICHDNSTGGIVWSKKMTAGSLIVANNKLIVVNKTGTLFFIEATPESFNELGSAKVFELAETDNKGRGYRRINGCWTNPVICKGKLYVRSSYGDLVCLDVSTS